MEITDKLFGAQALHETAKKPAELVGKLAAAVGALAVPVGIVIWASEGAGGITEPGALTGVAGFTLMCGASVSRAVSHKHNQGQNMPMSQEVENQAEPLAIDEEQ